MRQIIAFVTTPLVFSSLLFIYSYATNTSGGGWIFMFSALVGYVVIALCGLPMYFLLEKYRLKKITHYIIAGLVISLPIILYFIVYPIWSQMTNGIHFSKTHISQILFILFSCISTVSIFWLISRPDLQHEGVTHLPS